MIDEIFKVACAAQKEVARLLITKMEEIEGHVPTDAEIAAHGRCLIYPDRTKEWTWRGTVIVTQHPYRDGEIKIERMT